MPQSTEGETIELLAFELVEVNIQVRKADVDYASSDGMRPLYEHRTQVLRGALKSLQRRVIAEGKAGYGRDRGEIGRARRELLCQETQRREAIARKMGGVRYRRATRSGGRRYWLFCKGDPIWSEKATDVIDETIGLHR
ncbi:MAG: hypothetical protein ACREYE_28835 [Gammaproteobacteria bacterium]